MTEERFIPKCNFQKCQFIAHIKDNENQVVLDINDIVDLLNKQQATINELKERNAHNFAKKMQLIKENEQLRKELQEMKSDEKLYAQEILELNKTKKEMLNFKQLGGDY